MLLTGGFIICSVLYDASIACEECEWVGNLDDIKFCEGTCPKCGAIRFKYPELLSTVSWDEWFVEKTVTHTEHRYIVHHQVTVDELIQQSDKVWTRAPRGWHRPPRKEVSGCVVVIALLVTVAVLTILACIVIFCT